MSVIANHCNLGQIAYSNFGETKSLTIGFVCFMIIDIMRCLYDFQLLHYLETERMSVHVVKSPVVQL